MYMENLIPTAARIGNREAVAQRRLRAARERTEF